MSTEIAKAFGDLGLKITPLQCRKVIDMVAHYEVRGDNPLTLNSRLVGVHKMYFFPEDRAALFHIFDVEEKQISKLVRGISTINKSFKVASDSFNVFTVWLMHLATAQIKEKQLQHDVKIALAKYMSYKFFTSLSLQRFKYTVNEDVMMATMMSLTRKSDIITDGTWKKTITARMEDLIAPKSKLYDTFIEPTDDKFLRVITDVQTRLRKKLNLINSAFHEEHKRGNRLSSYNSAYTGEDGEKFLVQKESTVASAQFRITNDILNPNSWDDYRSVRAVHSKFPQISETLIHNALQFQSNEAILQSKTPKHKESGTVKGKEVLFSQRRLVSLIVETSVRQCSYRGIVFRDRRQAWEALQSAFSSSRITDPNVILIKNSVEHLIEQMGTVQRPATVSSLKLALIMYVVWRMLMSF